MATSGSGTITPISSGAATGTLEAQALPTTILSLHRYARIMGLDPVHFSQAYANNVHPVTRTCNDVWYKYAWQRADVVSREDLAYAIRNAERDIAQVLGYWPGPFWTHEEIADYPEFHRRDIWPMQSGLNVADRVKGVRTRWGKLRAVGKRAVAEAGTGVGVTYSDEDSDGFFETVTITLDISGSDAETILGKGWEPEYATSRNLKVYFAGKSGHPAWEIRPTTSHSYSGTTLTVTFRSWQLVDPGLQEQSPNTDGEPQPIDISDTDNLVSTVDIYLEYVDNAVASVNFQWDRNDGCTACNGSGCVVCNPQNQDGCASIRDRDTGLIVPLPATYDSANDQWEKAAATVSREPDMVEISYLSGAYDDDYLAGHTNDPLSDYMAKTIAYLATARLHEGVCACGNAEALVKRLMTDAVISNPGGTFIIAIDEAIENPFGTRVGELMAWRRVRRIADRNLDGYAL